MDSQQCAEFAGRAGEAATGQDDLDVDPLERPSTTLPSILPAAACLMPVSDLTTSPCWHLPWRGYDQLCCSEGLNALHCNLHQLRMLVPEASRIKAFSAGAYHGCLAFTALCRPAAMCLKKHCSAGGRQAN